jgi:nitroreductase
MDIGLMAAHVCFEATAQGLSTCILGWFDDEKIRAICDVEHPVRLVITLGYPGDKDKLREKKRKALGDLVSYVEWGGRWEGGF